MFALWLITIPVVVSYLSLLYFFIFRPAPSFIRKLVVVFTTIVLILSGLHILSWQNLPPFWRWLFDLDSEWALGAMFSSTQLVMVGLAALALGVLAPLARMWQRGYWILLALVFVSIGIDEYARIHEFVGTAQDIPIAALGQSGALNAYLLLLGSAWRTLYATVGFVVVSITVLAYLRGNRDEKRLYATLGVGLALMGLGGLLIDIITWDYLLRAEMWQSIALKSVLLEEFLEMGGVLVLLAGIASYGHKHLPDTRWQAGRRFVAFGGVAWLLMLLFNLWPRPILESRLFAEPVQADYLEGAVSLIGYHLSSETVRPGEPLDITLYFQAHRQTPDVPFELTVQMLTETEMDRVAEFSTPFDQNSIIPMAAWLPGMVIRQPIRLAVPDDLPAPASYLLMVRLWSDSYDVQITQTDRRPIGPDSLVLVDLPVPPDADPPPPPVASTYHFGDGFTLYGYTLPEQTVSGDVLSLAFWWRTDHPSGRYLIQFVHVFGPEDQLAFSYDQEPFGGAFPTTDWPSGIAMTDVWHVSVPADLPPGSYTLFTGMYEWPSLERSSVVDGNGQPVENGLIYLGTLTLGP